MNSAKNYNTDTISNNYKKWCSTLPRYIPKICSNMCPKKFIITPKIEIFCWINRANRYNYTHPSSYQDDKAQNHKESYHSCDENIYPWIHSHWVFFKKGIYAIPTAYTKKRSKEGHNERYTYRWAYDIPKFLRKKSAEWILYVEKDIFLHVFMIILFFVFAIFPLCIYFFCLPRWWNW